MSRKKEFGDFQTPQAFAFQICQFLKDHFKLTPQVVIEPTCGVGAFVKGSMIFNAAYVIGLEVNPEYCSECRRNIEQILENTPHPSIM